MHEHDTGRDANGHAERQLDESDEQGKRSHHGTRHDQGHGKRTNGTGHDPENRPPRTVVITGAGGGVGSAVATSFRARGWNLALFDSGRNADRLRNQFPSALVVTGDLRSRRETASAVAEARERYRNLDALAHLAGGFAMGPVRETGADDIEHMLDVNFRTLVTTVEAVLPGMLERGTGSVLGVAAGQVLEGGRNVTAYAASKGALVGYLRALRSEVERAGLGVGIVFPMGAIDTAANRRAMPNTDPDAWIAASEVATALVYLAERTTRGRVGEIRLEAVPPAT